jgi:hypothetical protein
VDRVHPFESALSPGANRANAPIPVARQPRVCCGATPLLARGGVG